MPVRLIRLFLMAAMILVGVGGVLGAGATIIAAAAGHAERTTLRLKIEGSPPQPVFDAGRQSVGVLTVDRGTLNLKAGGPAYAMIQLVDIVVTCGLWLLVLATTRTLVGRIAQRQPFESSSVSGLRRIGWSLIALNVWGWLRMIAVPPLLLTAINPVAGNYRILPSISENVPGLQNARVDSSLSLGLLAAGIIILVLAQAFRIGGELRAENEAIV